MYTMNELIDSPNHECQHHKYDDLKHHISIYFNG
uniref:Uncharacterized protein n=1 Tax=Rhizophora mucronata TaxID=61149 RepID=A0A2P2P855_RHIMU